MPYQDFGIGTSDSKSHQKLAAIKLPTNLSGKRLLDIGCNEGFFCHEALERGAERVVGIDLDPKIIEQAKIRVPNAEFKNCSWWQIPEEKYDVILFLSAIHYERNQKGLLDFLLSRLNQGGLLILECGVIRNDWDEKWHVVERHDGLLAFPSWGLLLNRLLENYAVRDIGRSVDQAGDPIERYVFHCTHLKPIVLFLSGDSQSGKTVMAREFRKSGCRVINLDFEYGKIINENKTFLRNKAISYLAEVYSPNSIDRMLHRMAADGKAEEINNLIKLLIGREANITVIEGYHLALEPLKNSLKEILLKDGYLVREVVL